MTLKAVSFQGSLDRNYWRYGKINGICRTLKLSKLYKGKVFGGMCNIKSMLERKHQYEDNHFRNLLDSLYKMNHILY